MNIYISNLGDKVTDASLEAIFSSHGQVSSSRVILDGFTGYSRGFGFVEMPDDSEAALAIAKVNGTVIDGRAIEVKEAKPQVEHKGSYSVGRKTTK
jgi:RNA recognition motif-containing protein